LAAVTRPVIDAAAYRREFGTIGNLLRRPTGTVDLREFAENLAAHSISYRLAGLASAVRDLALLGRIRGALGDELLRGASPQSAQGAPCPWEPPCAFEALFRKQGRMTQGSDFPSPWVLSLAPHRDDLLVRMSLFGIACEWGSAAAEALTIVLMERVDWKEATGGFAPAPRIASRKVEATTVPTNSATHQLILDFMSPLVISSRNGTEDPRPAFMSFGLRLEGIARWHGLSLAQVDWRAMAGMLNALTWEWEDVVPVAWHRGSRRQDKWITMRGVIGRLVVSGAALDDPQLSALFRLGALIHVGADIAFGCGRYEIVG
jgi:CRISPR-associated endoribonuclease Cas6